MREKIWKRMAAFLLVVELCFGQVGMTDAAERKELAPDELYSKSCVLMDGEGERILYGKEETLPLANASTTKIMTCILALENASMDEVVTVGKEAAAQPKVHLGMKEGEQFYMRDLLYGLMLESYNDCAYAIAEHIDKTVEAFAARMNAKAGEIGCEDTHFVTPNGLDRDDAGGSHHTTAADLCRIMSYCTWKSPVHETFVALTQTRDYTFADLEGKSFTVSNKNAFLDQMDCVISGKTGFTGKAGYCYVAAAQENGRKFCIALLACGWPNNKNYKWKDARKLFDYGLDNYHLYEADVSALKLGALSVGNAYRDGTLKEWGKRMEIRTYIDAKEDKISFLKADWDDAKTTRSYEKIVKPPVQKGDVLGAISFQIGGQEMYHYRICAKDTVKQWDFTAFLHALWMEIT